MKKNKFTKKQLAVIEELGPQEYELMLLGWLRYCLGRQSYIVGACERNITTQLSTLSDWCLNNIEDDLERYAVDVENDLTSWGSDYDKSTWLRLWDELVIEINKRKAKGKYLNY